MMTDEAPAAQQDDFVRDLIRWMIEVDPSFGAKALQFELWIRREWGGTRPYIARRSLMLRRARENVLATVGTKPDMAVARESGISRATFYRWLSKEKEGKR